ncbi:MAG: HIT family protein [Galactobacter sp.]
MDVPSSAADLAALGGYHEPADYACPFCELVDGTTPFSPTNLCEPTDLVYQDSVLTVLIACDGFGEFEGHAMIVPNRHHENIYDLPDNVLTAISLMSRRVALASREAWGPGGTSLRQHNEPAGNQHVWHYHLHVFPRFDGDRLYQQLRHRVDVDVRARKAQELRAALLAVLALEG